jgi:hypothetical protein
MRDRQAPNVIGYKRLLGEMRDVLLPVSPPVDILKRAEDDMVRAGPDRRIG